MMQRQFNGESIVFYKKMVVEQLDGHMQKKTPQNPLVHTSHHIQKSKGSIFPQTRQTDSPVLGFRGESAQSISSLCLHQVSDSVEQEVNSSNLETRDFQNLEEKKIETAIAPVREKRRLADDSQWSFPRSTECT